MIISKAKGCYDLYGDEAKKFKMAEKVIEEVMGIYNINYIRTPVFENSELFRRGVGEETDIVSKEMYEFKDKSDRSLTLRPEGTAGVVRSYIENKMTNNLVKPVKFYYLEPMYRYERPQKGRYREFTQFGIEVLGESNPLIDIEVISAVIEIFNRLGLENIKLKINTLGDKETREKYKKLLINHFNNYKDNLCSDCQRRLVTNPLRILDCKIDREKKFFKEAPKIRDYLSEKSKKYFEKIEEYLKSLNIDYEIDDNLVRGLDYYDELVFEIEVDNSTICGGGRYNRLVKELGGDDTCAFGFAIGMERFLSLLELPKETEDLTYILALSDSERLEALKLARYLRNNNKRVDFDTESKSLKSQFKKSDNLNSRYLIFINDEKLKYGKVEIKDTLNSIKEEIEIDKILEYLK
jgi:histidine--tRNA ligase